MELAALSLEAGRLEDAEAKARESLELANRMRDYGGRVFGVGVLACVAAAARELSGPAGSGVRSRTTGSGRPSAAGSGIVQPARLTSRSTRGPELEAALAVGRELSLDDAVELALANARSPSRPGHGTISIAPVSSVILSNELDCSRRWRARNILRLNPKAPPCGAFLLPGLDSNQQPSG